MWYNLRIKSFKKDYPTRPFYNNLEDKYEDKFFEDGVPNDLSDELKKKIVEVYSVNNRNLQKYIESMNPDLIITFGMV